ncbi:MAG: CinA family protein [Oscillospiraceae bacterium]|nr:CinA family protein [Oscillospiraceae bacterium]
MMTRLSYDVIAALKGRTLVTAESCTGGGIGAALTAVPGSSAVFKGGIISYTNEVKISQLNVDREVLNTCGAVSDEVAKQMATGVRKNLAADYAVSVTGLAGPDGDEFGNPVGTVFIGFADENGADVRKFQFPGNREDVRNQAICAALAFVLEKI